MTSESLAAILDDWLKGRSELLDRAHKARGLAHPDALRRITNVCLQAAEAST